MLNHPMNYSSMAIDYSCETLLFLTEEAIHHRPLFTLKGVFASALY